MTFDVSCSVSIISFIYKPNSTLLYQIKLLCSPNRAGIMDDDEEFDDDYNFEDDFESDDEQDLYVSFTSLGRKIHCHYINLCLCSGGWRRRCGWRNIPCWHMVGQGSFSIGRTGLRII